MDADRFDALSKTLGAGRTRRGLARLLAGLSLGSVFSVARLTDVAAGSRLGGAPCTSNSQCQTQQCLGSKCSCSQSVGCASPGRRCMHGGCFSSCPSGQSCTVSIDCHTGDTDSCVCFTTGTKIICGDVHGTTFDCATLRTCTGNAGCPTGQVCVDIPNCCPGKSKVCRRPCRT
jgi:hypothetical protein